MHKNIKLYILLLMPFFAFAAAYYLINYHPGAICIWKRLLHTECWGCGITRAFYSLCKLDFVSAWNYNPRIFIITPLLIYIWINELHKACKNQKI